MRRLAAFAFLVSLVRTAPARADDAPSIVPADVVVTIGDEPSDIIAADPAPPTIELPVVMIGPSANPAPSTSVSRADDLVMDPASGLMVPRFAVSPPRRAHRARIHLDPTTGLMIPDSIVAGDATSPPVRTSASTRESSSASPTASPATANGLHLDPATGLMIPDEFAAPRHAPHL